MTYEDLKQRYKDLIEQVDGVIRAKQEAKNSHCCEYKTQKALWQDYKIKEKALNERIWSEKHLMSQGLFNETK